MFELERVRPVNLIRISIILVLVSVVSGCASNMVLYKKDIAGLDFSSGALPNTANCKAIKKAYDLGLTRNLKKGTRWAEREGGARYQCNSHDPITCENVYGRVTSLTKNDEKILYGCMGDIRRKKQQEMKAKEEYSREQVKIQKQLQRDVTTKEILARLASIEFNGVAPMNAYLDWNMYSFAEEIITSVDVNDFKGLVVLGMRENPYVIDIQENKYVVLQVTKDRVYLTCGEKCGLPVIGIVRVNERPSPIERVEYNDTKGVYMFLRTEHYYTQRNRIGGVSNQIQALLFHRITMKDLGLPNDFFEKTHSDLSVLN